MDKRGDGEIDRAHTAKRRNLEYSYYILIKIDIYWKEIAGEMQMAPSEIKNKCNSLRCSFRTTFNKMNSTKSGQGASTKPPPQICHLLKFLEPTLRLEAPTISNLSEDLGTLDTIDENENTQTPTIVAKRRRNDD
ncbi:PREDICTED: uncharacterized protein LOC108360128 [Rhagoletis zephyria]|uniref:uncharacterized protein LOC108360128 n=1 Tax=Rhagoletis zephyria TaxID=28612 RepID=UPI0008119062|nr:PREDICTED: uncharacterized protein LOC108360128 [Rhagoletis zephyria]